MSWWDHLHPEEGGSSLGVPIPLDCARALAGEPVLIKNGFDGFHATKLHEILHQQGVDTVIIFGLITRFSWSQLWILNSMHRWSCLVVENTSQSLCPQYPDVCLQPRVRLWNICHITVTKTSSGTYKKQIVGAPTQSICHKIWLSWFLRNGQKIWPNQGIYTTLDTYLPHTTSHVFWRIIKTLN